MTVATTTTTTTYMLQPFLVLQRCEGPRLRDPAHPKVIPDLIKCRGQLLMSDRIANPTIPIPGKENTTNASVFSRRFLVVVPSLSWLNIVSKRENGKKQAALSAPRASQAVCLGKGSHTDDVDVADVNRWRDAAAAAAAVRSDRGKLHVRLVEAEQAAGRDVINQALHA